MGNNVTIQTQTLVNTAVAMDNAANETEELKNKLINTLVFDDSWISIAVNDPVQSLRRVLETNGNSFATVLRNCATYLRNSGEGYCVTEVNNTSLSEAFK